MCSFYECDVCLFVGYVHVSVGDRDSRHYSAGPIIPGFFSSCKTETLCPLNTTPYQYSQPWQQQLYFQFLWIWLFHVSHIIGTKYYLCFCDQLIFFSVMSSRFIHVVKYVRIPFSLKTWVMFHYISYIYVCLSFMDPLERLLVHILVTLLIFGATFTLFFIVTVQFCIVTNNTQHFHFLHIFADRLPFVF